MVAKASIFDSMLVSTLMTFFSKDTNSSCDTSWTYETSIPSWRSWIYSLRSSIPFSMPCSIKSNPSRESVMASSILASPCLYVGNDIMRLILPTPTPYNRLGLPSTSLLTSVINIGPQHAFFTMPALQPYSNINYHRLNLFLSSCDT